MIKYLEKEEDFKKEISEGVTLVDFYADWCGPCKMMGKVLEDVDANILKVNTDNFDSIAMSFGIMSIPTIIIFKDGKEMVKTIGLQDKSEVERLIDSVK